MNKIQSLLDRLRKECMRADVAELDNLALKLERMAQWVRETRAMLDDTGPPGG